MKISLEEAGKRLGVSAETVRRRIKKGDIAGEKIKVEHGYQWFIDDEELRSSSPTVAVDVVELKKTVSANDLAMIVAQVQSPLVHQLAQQDILINELLTKIDDLSCKVDELSSKQHEQQHKTLLQRIFKK